ncbi:BtrH N-terminal domain-containing protein [Streptomyces sp. NPDC058255]|uniref:BtrH N-terminal domain-containing protein n=1 Tax=Streptomyces sp. NPDC058255 TaxID=3346407 RepID=UPI0036ED25DC
MTTLNGLTPWRHDLAGCLHADMASLLAFHGRVPLEVLGAAWEFFYRPGDVRREEYYFPCKPGTSLLASMAPHHPVRSVWHHPADAEQGWAQVREAVAGGRPVAVTVDNFELPFRPAYQDVHANHMILVHGFDEERGTVRVMDAVPPRFDGEIPLSRLAAARDSGNEIEHDRDMFFTDAPIANRWLDIEIDEDRFPAFDRAFVRRVIEANGRSFRAPQDLDAASALTGLAGQRTFLDGMAKRRAAGEDIRDELFVTSGVLLATTALHADWLAHAARGFDVPELAEAARQVERTAHHWSAVRILAARTRTSTSTSTSASTRTRTGPTTADQLVRRFDELMDDQQRALRELDRALTVL